MNKDCLVCGNENCVEHHEFRKNNIETEMCYICGADISAGHYLICPEHEE